MLRNVLRTAATLRSSSSSSRSSSAAMGDVSEMDYEKVKSGLEDNSIILLDVRTTEERKEKHGAIPGSKHIWSKLLRTFLFA